MHQNLPQSLSYPLTRNDYAVQICRKLEQSKAALQAEFSQPKRISSFYLDHLLDEEAAQEIYAAFPDEQQMRELKSLREHKYVAMQLDQFDSKVEEIIYAFQDPRVVALISEITGIPMLLPDPQLYAGGISVMHQGHYLNPHLDNSHNKSQDCYRVLNLLYYVSPGWQVEFGGNLELWDQGVSEPCRTIEYRFNRLVVMVTNSTSWHSVSPICHPVRRCCVSNYYFSQNSPEARSYRHVTSFRGRPDQRLRDWILRGDALLRNGFPEELKKQVRRSDYYYKKRS